MENVRVQIMDDIAEQNPLSMEHDNDGRYVWPKRWSLLREMLGGAEQNPSANVCSTGEDVEAGKGQQDGEVARLKTKINKMVSWFKKFEPDVDLSQFDL